MVVSDTFCWRISKVNGCCIIGWIELAVAVAVNLEITRYYIYGDIGDLSILCHSRGDRNSYVGSLNCPPAEVNRTIMYGLAFITFVCNFINLLHPFSLLHAYKTEVAVILIPQIVSGIVKLICLFVYTVLAALFLPTRAIILLVIIVFEHYKIRHSLFLYAHLSDKRQVDLVVQLRGEAKRHLAYLSDSIGPPTYEEVTSTRGPLDTATPLNSTEYQVTEPSASTRIDVSHTIPLINVENTTRVIMAGCNNTPSTRIEVEPQALSNVNDSTTVVSTVPYINIAPNIVGGVSTIPSNAPSTTITVESHTTSTTDETMPMTSNVEIHTR